MSIKSIGMFTPTSITKFTGGYHIRAFSPKTFLDLPSRLKLKTEFEGYEKEDIANLIGLNINRAPIEVTNKSISKNVVRFLMSQYYRKSSTIPLKRRDDFKTMGREKMAINRIARICIPEDVLEPMNIAKVLLDNIDARYSKVSMKDKDDRYSLILLTSSYLKHLNYENPFITGAALGRLIGGCGLDLIKKMLNIGGVYNFMYNVLLNLYFDKENDDFGISLSSAITHLINSNEILKNSEFLKIGQNVFEYIKPHWHNWPYLNERQLKYETLTEVKKFARDINSFDYLPFVILKTAVFNITFLDEKSIDILYQSIAAIVDSLSISMCDKINLIIQTAKLVKTKYSYNNRDFQPEESIKYLLGWKWT